jgi:DNA primase
MLETDKNKLKILAGIFGSYRRTGDEYLFRCPVCKHHKYKFSVNIKKNAAKCWVCNYKRKNLQHIIKSFGLVSDLQEWKKLDGKVDFSDLLSAFDTQEDQGEEKIKLPDEFETLVTHNLSIEGQIAKKYILSRRISEDLIFLYKMGYCSKGTYAGRIIIPSFDEFGKLNYFIARTYTDHWKKYLNPKINRNNIIANELYVDWNKEIILVEGMFDAIKAGLQAIPLLGSTLSAESRLFQKIVSTGCKVTVALDNDAKEKENSIINKLISYRVPDVRKISIPVEYNDIGEMSCEEFQQVHNNFSLPMDEENHLKYLILQV